MNRNNLWVIAILAVSAVLFTCGVVKKIRHVRAAAGQKTIAVIPKGTAAMWWAVVRNGAEKAGQEENVRIIWSGPEQETDRERQIQIVEDALIQHVDAVVLGPNDSNALARSVDKIHQAGIPCVIIDSTVNTKNYDSFVATDNYMGGATAAKLLAEAMGQKGNVLLIRFVPNSASTDARAQGFIDTLKKDYPQMKIIAEQSTLGSVEDARQRTVDLLTKHKQVDGIFAVNQPTAIGAYKAITTQGSGGKIKYVGFDSDPVLLEGIEKGEVYALVAQNPFDIGYTGVKTAVQLLKKQQVKAVQPVDAFIVNKANLEDMKKRFPAALGL